MIEYADFPIDDLARMVKDAMVRGGSCYLKFTCAGCGSRQTIDEANKLYTQGKCEECGAITDIQKRGGNLLIVFPALR